MTISSSGLIEWTPTEEGQIKTYSNITITITTASGYVITQTFDLSVITASYATTIAVGGGFNCAMLDNGTVKCFGWNSSGQLGIDNDTQMGDDTGEMAQLTGINLGTGRTATAISAGMYHTCAKLDNGAVKCWGRNNLGQLGIGNTTYMGDGSGEMASLPSVNL